MHTQGCHINKRNVKLVMHKKSAEWSTLKWDSFEIWLRKSIRRPFITLQVFFVILHRPHDLEKVTLLSI